jgi:hypothetical protein
VVDKFLLTGAPAGPVHSGRGAVSRAVDCGDEKTGDVAAAIPAAKGDMATGVEKR